jgi:hypothetical protein
MIYVVLDRALPAHIDNGQAILFIVDAKGIKIGYEISALDSTAGFIELLKPAGVDQLFKFGIILQVLMAYLKIEAYLLTK